MDYSDNLIITYKWLTCTNVQLSRKVKGFGRFPKRVNEKGINNYALFYGWKVYEKRGFENFD